MPRGADAGREDGEQRRSEGRSAPDETRTLFRGEGRAAAAATRVRDRDLQECNERRQQGRSSRYFGIFTLVLKSRGSVQVEFRRWSGGYPRLRNHGATERRPEPRARPRRAPSAAARSSAAG